MIPKELLTNQLAKLLLTQSGILRVDEDLIQDPKTPASVADILRSEKYWNSKINNLKGNEKWNTKQKTSIKA